MKIRLPDRHDLAVILGFGIVVAGVAQVLPWLAICIAGGALVYVGIFTEDAEEPEK